MDLLYFCYNFVREAAQLGAGLIIRFAGAGRSKAEYVLAGGELFEDGRRTNSS